MMIYGQLTNLIEWTTALSNSMKLSHAMWDHRRRTGHGGEVWQCGPLEKGVAKHLVFLPREPYEQGKVIVLQYSVGKVAPNW